MGAKREVRERIRRGERILDETRRARDRVEVLREALGEDAFDSAFTHTSWEIGESGPAPSERYTSRLEFLDSKVEGVGILLESLRDIDEVLPPGAEGIPSGVEIDAGPYGDDLRELLETVDDSLDGTEKAVTGILNETNERLGDVVDSDGRTEVRVDEYVETNVEIEQEDVVANRSSWNVYVEDGDES